MRFIKNYISRILFFIVVVIVLACAGSQENVVQENTTNTNREDSDNFIVKLRGGPIIPESANTIFIAPIENLTNKPELTQTLSMLLRRQVATEGRLAVVDNDSSADLVLILRINSYHVQNLEHNKRGVPSKQRLRITGLVSLFDRQAKTHIFRNNEVQSFKIFSQVVMPIQTELQCCEDVLKMMADRIYLMVKTGWYSDLLTEIEKGKR